MQRTGKKKRKVQQLQLSVRATVSDVAGAAIAESLSRLREHMPDALGRQRPESLHQARVSLRRLRTYVRLFRSRIGRKRAREIGDELRWAFRLLGKLRDIQVFTRDVVAHVESPKRELAAFRVRLAQRATTAGQALQKPATRRRFEALSAALEAITESLGERRDDERARPWLGARLDRQRRRLRLNEERLLAAGTDLHDLRKRAKRLRYTSDLARGLGKQHTKRERRFRTALSALQDNLGALNDVKVGHALLRTARAPAALRAHVREILEAAGRAHRAELPNVYACFVAAPPFWR